MAMVTVRVKFEAALASYELQGRVYTPDRVLKMVSEKQVPETWLLPSDAAVDALICQEGYYDLDYRLVSVEIV